MERVSLMETRDGQRQVEHLAMEQNTVAFQLPILEPFLTPVKNTSILVSISVWIIYRSKLLTKVRSHLLHLCIRSPRFRIANNIDLISLCNIARRPSLDKHDTTVIYYQLLRSYVA